MGEIARQLSQNRQRELSPRFESLAFVGSHISLENTEISPHRPCVRCAAIRIAIGVPSCELTAFAEHWRLAIGDYAHLRCSRRRSGSTCWPANVARASEHPARASEHCACRLCPSGISALPREPAPNPRLGMNFYRAFLEVI